LLFPPIEAERKSPRSTRGVHRPHLKRPVISAEGLAFGMLLLRARPETRSIAFRDTQRRHGRDHARNTARQSHHAARSYAAASPWPVRQPYLWAAPAPLTP